MIKPGPENSICDVDGILVGNASEDSSLTGVTVVLPTRRAVAAADIRGGAPGTRETELLNPSNTVNEVDAVVLSGGSVFGLEAASSVTRWLSDNLRGIEVRGATIPIVPSAIIFDFSIGASRNWSTKTPFDLLAREACNKANRKVQQGNIGAGIGATAGKLKGGLGTSSFVTEEGWQIGAIAVTNSFGSVVVPGTKRFWAGDVEYGEEFGGFGVIRLKPKDIDYQLASEAMINTTVCVVATNLQLTKAEASRIAIMSQDGIARAVRPAHTPFDGDSVFVLSTGALALPKPAAVSLGRLGNLAGDCVSRAIARGVYHADSLRDFPSYKTANF